MFYTFVQNNSGGYYKSSESEGIGEYVIIEANSAMEVNRKAEDIGIYFNGVRNGLDCECCGDRWYPCSESAGSEEPLIWGEPVRECGSNRFDEEAYLHYANGAVERVELKPRTPK